MPEEGLGVSNVTGISKKVKGKDKNICVTYLADCVALD